MEYLISVLFSLTIGIGHGIEPDHVSTARLYKKDYKKIIKFAMFHSAGYLIIAIPLVYLASLFEEEIIILADAIGIIFGALLLVETITGREFDIEPKFAGTLQGSVVLTPSKILTIILAFSSAFPFNVLILLAFALGSMTSIIALGLLTLIPERFSFIFNIAVSVITIAYILYQLITTIT
ncbi:hypothetical protein [Sulfuracidifex tepidarius]|uniref:Nickel/cobalt efflux system n=1 Tax=Sulfuracidifex tepidarius TaxID=1294262 RepID=A0A510DZ68_9CREN|nr:hypothetical protein [Sulfuracidifex tepidarius]BBG25449.1 hypothetical protein IC006_2785 [Sulfuracidifex tepidarius]BBG28243.1 hypothetical protein IC007_2799 [Sulfuracidifex tepidarius]